MRFTRWYQFNTSARINYGTLTQIRLQIALYVLTHCFKVPETVFKGITAEERHILWRVVISAQQTMGSTSYRCLHRASLF